MHRLRFAPSPTGLIHIGGLRTLLYNYFFAKQNKGQFILRVEDTDPTRTVPNSVENLVSITKWLGIEFDEGPHLPASGNHGPYYQSERLNIYKEHVSQLLQENHAYHCFCPPKKDIFVPTFMPLKRCNCRSLDPSEARKRSEEVNHVVRLKTPESGFVIVDDKVFHSISFEHSKLDDVILLKSNGYPSYHMANVVDDHLMEISHVLRGAEWISSLPIHVMLYKYFSWEPPVFAHLPLLVDETNRTKLSKRRADTSIQFFRDEGYLPEALINAVSLITFKPKSKVELFTREELIESFNLTGIHTSNAGVSLRKFGWYNKMHLDRLISDDMLRGGLVSELEELLSQTDYYSSADGEFKNKQYIENVLLAFPTRMVLLKEIPNEHSYFWRDPSCDLLLAYVDSVSADPSGIILKIRDKFKQLDFSQDLTEISFSDWALKLNTSTQVLLTLLRLALSGCYKGPTFEKLVSILGKERVISRLENSLDKLKLPREEINS